MPDTGELREGYHIPATVLDCDKLISVPPLKTHSCATTLALKNYVGILPTHPSGVVRKGDVHQGDFQKGFVDLFSYHPADYSLLEGFWGTEGNGPQWGENVRHNVAIAGADPVAVDAVGSDVMGFNPDDIDYLHYAAQKGFGTLDLEEIEVVGAPVEQVWRKFKTASGRKGVPFTARGNRRWLVREGEEEEWTVYESEERYIDLARFFGERPAESAQAAVEVHAKRGLSGWLWASADGKMRVELNGRVVAEKTAESGHKLGEFKVEVELEEGDNRLVVEVERGAAGMGFTAILCDAEGYGLRGVEHRAEVLEAVS